MCVGVYVWSTGGSVGVQNCVVALNVCAVRMKDEGGIDFSYIRVTFKTLKHFESPSERLWPSG